MVYLRLWWEELGLDVASEGPEQVVTLNLASPGFYTQLP